MPSLYKIGMTQDPDAEARAAALSRGTGVPRDFKIELALPCYYPKHAERHIFHTLRYYRYSTKEFFNLALPALMRIVSRIIHDHYSQPDPALSYLSPTPSPSLSANAADALAALYRMIHDPAIDFDTRKRLAACYIQLYF